MSKLILIGAILVLNVVWQVFPFSYDQADWIDFFPLNDQKLPWQNYVYHATQKMAWAMLTWMLFREAKEYRVALFAFFAVNAFKLLEYFISYNRDWFHVGKFAVSSNTVGLLIYDLAVLYEFIKWDQRRY